MRRRARYSADPTWYWTPHGAGRRSYFEKLERRFPDELAAELAKL